MTTLVFAGGDAPAPGLADVLPPASKVIAADSGLDHASSLGVEVDRVIGDMDSVDGDLLDSLSDSVQVDRHPTAKDATDLELALEAALEGEPDELIVVGGHGGRSDHFLANALLLGSPRFAHLRIRWFAGTDLIEVVHHSAALRGAIGATVSLVPLSDCTGVTTTGLAWVLHDASLQAGTTRGVSNRFDATEATVTVASGSLLVIQPGVLGTPGGQE